MKAIFVSVLAKVESVLVTEEAITERKTYRRFVTIALVAIAYAGSVILVLRQL